MKIGNTKHKHSDPTNLEKHNFSTLSRLELEMFKQRSRHQKRPWVCMFCMFGTAEPQGGYELPSLAY